MPGQNVNEYMTVMSKQQLNNELKTKLNCLGF